MQNDDQDKKISDAMARGIRQEKTRESIAVFQVIGAILLSLIIGGISDLPMLGAGLLLVLFALIWWRYNR
ncbi:hypothetical protein SFMTTN_2044 [Sulfuriferula multivorans]|uniref:Uncharacterized protein n=1 Tax=Sulfuriferula multivorans TaxID=1559896 RepID=A0A401JF26_9PROT|nr:hypothetical protein [Sulfuriferula multivorans]GBL46231.1 hypothetical protein SFMTTN_2044 [Sulfuriferula multivorans]